MPDHNLIRLDVESAILAGKIVGCRFDEYGTQYLVDHPRYRRWRSRSSGSPAASHTVLLLDGAIHFLNRFREKVSFTAGGTFFGRNVREAHFDLAAIRQSAVMMHSGHTHRLHGCATRWTLC